jgi:hypothetical protein
MEEKIHNFQNSHSVSLSKSSRSDFLRRLTWRNTHMNFLRMKIHTDADFTRMLQRLDKKHTRETFQSISI